ncbi:MAG TPA: BRCT domain-containing protein [Actinocrinis sp.]
MTTLTPADQAGGESGAQVSGIPAQRSGQALRLLVLGAGNSADAAREQAAATGAEIAQRFSNRVTHVAVDDSVGAEDPRVMRARAAGVPVLRVDEVAALVGLEGLAEAGEVADVVKAAEVVKVAGRTNEGKTANTTSVTKVADVATDTAVASALEAELSGDAGGTGGRVEGDSGRDGDAGRSALADPAADPHGLEGYGESVPRVQEVEVLAASPLEAALVFPPLPPDVIRDGAAVDEVARGEQEAAVGVRTRVRPRTRMRGETVEGDTAASRAEAAEVAETAEATEVAADEIEGAEAGAGGGVHADDVQLGDGDGGGAGTRAASEFQAAGVKADDEGSAAAEAELEFAGAFGPTGEASMSASATAVSLAWAAVPLVSMGLLTPVSLGYAAYRLRSRKLAAATAWYTVAVSVAFAISATHPSASEARTSATSGGVLTACLAASWVGGTIHSFLIRRRVFR